MALAMLVNVIKPTPPGGEAGHKVEQTQMLSHSLR